MACQTQGSAGAITNGSQLLVAQAVQVKDAKLSIDRGSRINHVVDAIGAFNVAIVRGNLLHPDLPTIPSFPQQGVDLNDRLVVVAAGVIHTSLLIVTSRSIGSNRCFSRNSTLGKVAKMGF